jgi:hypothetical protein
MITPVADFLAGNRFCRVNGLRPLGGIQLLSSGDTITIEASSTPAGCPSVSLRVGYEAGTLLVRFDNAPQLRCAYSFLPLDSRPAVRCPGCNSVYAADVWASELRGRCPACGAEPEEGPPDELAR